MPGVPQPKVSIIINVRNGADTLGATLDSVLAQTWRDWEIVLWDDGSTDDSLQIAASYSGIALRCFQSPGPGPLGLGPARDHAIRAARGEWIAFLDQDDLWLPHKLEQQLALGDADPAVGLVYGRTISFRPDGHEFDYDHRHEFSPLPEGDIFERLWIDSCFIAISSTLMRRSMVEALGRIPPGYLVSPDYFLYLGLARQHRVACVQQVVCRYRLHQHNMSHVVNGRIQQEVLQLVDLWQHALPAPLAAHRRRVHSTVWAVQELRRPGSRAQGLRRLWRDGSLVFLAGRPLAWAWRKLRRRLQTPQWQQSAPGVAAGA